MNQKFLDLAGLTAYDRMLKEWIKASIVDITDDAINALFVVSGGQLDNEIWYTSSDGNVITPQSTDVFGANIISNTYEDGRGTIKFDNSVTSIGNMAFPGLPSLTSITIPDSVTNLGDWAFTNCTSLTSITIPNNVTSIGNEAFEGCSSLTLVAIGNSVASIGARAFYSCKSLTSITIPNSVASIRGSAFEECSSLTSITFEGTMEEWNSIEKYGDWNTKTPATYVQCSDGQVTL